MEDSNNMAGRNRWVTSVPNRNNHLILFEKFGLFLFTSVIAEIDLNNKF